MAQSGNWVKPPDKLPHVGRGDRTRNLDFLFGALKVAPDDVTAKAIEERGAWACIKPMPGRLDPPAFSAFLYRHRNLVERFFNKLKHFRAVATRYEKYADNYLALVKLAAVRIWLRSYESVS